jgi:GNAT superfamily N-acetyltransferase
MSQTARIDDLADTAAFPPAEPLRLTGTVDVASDDADAQWGFVRDDQLVARCAVWWKETPRHLDQRVGFVGRYAATDAATGARLIEHACQKLRAEGCSLAVAPVDGNTWRSYRFITESGTEPRFLFEPDHPAGWPDHFCACGFDPFARYFSALNTDLTYQAPALRTIIEDLRRQGVEVRPLNETRFNEDLHKIHGVASHAFRQHLLYSQISFLDFADYYKQLRTRVPLDLTLLAEQRGRLVGFVFAVSDLLQQQRGKPVTSVIVKSLAILPDPNLWGLGQWLLERVHEMARKRGLHRAIYALLRDKPSARKRTAIYARRIRGYTLFSKVLRT